MTLTIFLLKLGWINHFFDFRKSFWCLYVYNKASKGKNNILFNGHYNILYEIAFMPRMGTYVWPRTQYEATQNRVVKDDPSIFMYKTEIRHPFTTYTNGLLRSSPLRIKIIRFRPWANSLSGGRRTLIISPTHIGFGPRSGSAIHSRSPTPIVYEHL